MGRGVGGVLGVVWGWFGGVRFWDGLGVLGVVWVWCGGGVGPNTGRGSACTSLSQYVR